MKKTMLPLALIILLFVGLALWYWSTQTDQPSPPTVTNQPARTDDQEPSDRIAAPIRITDPQPDSVITSPLTVTGEARGTWYFEASFPVEIRDANNNLVAQHYAQALDEWMTEDFVPFESVVTFEAPATDTGTLILRKDNPSGLPEFDQQIDIPIRFR